MNNLTAFLTGLGTGGLTCLAVQGGLLIGLLAKKDDALEEQASKWQRLLLPVSGFLIAKIIVYTLFGFLLGVIGAKLQFSTATLAWLQALAAVFMVVTGVRLIWPHWLPWLAITPPAAVRRFVRRSAKSELLIAPMVLGALTILIPCGTTFAMEAAALATGNPWSAAGILFYFVLGTAPLFFLIGVLAKGTTLLQQKLKYATAALVVATGIYSFNAVLVSIDSPYSWQNKTAAIRAVFNVQSPGSSAVAVTEPVINVLPTGYDPEQLTVPAGQRLDLKLNVPGGLSCTSIFRIPKLGIERQLRPNSSTIVAVTFPKPGSYTFTCGMGMFSGTITAV